MSYVAQAKTDSQRRSIQRPGNSARHVAIQVPEQTGKFLVKFLYGKVPAFEYLEEWTLLEGSSITRYRKPPLLSQLDTRTHPTQTYSV